jgi:hypothetical protein
MIQNDRLVSTFCAVALFLLLSGTDGFSSMSRRRIFSRGTASLQQRTEVAPMPLLPSTTGIIQPLSFCKSIMENDEASKSDARFRIGSWWKRRTSPRRKSDSKKIGRRAMLISAASVLVTLVARPTMALAMGGGMGGLKGPVAPMQRYVWQVMD